MDVISDLECLLQSINKLKKLASIVRMLGIDETLRLSHVNFLIKNTIQECYI